MRRAVPLLAVLLLAACAVLLLLHATGSQGDDVRRPERAHPTTDAAAEPREGEAPAPSADAPHLVGSAPELEAGPSPIAPRDAVPAPHLVGAWVEVTVERPADWPPSEGWIYAFPAGGAGVEEADGVPHVRLLADAEDPARLPLPRAGTWDVGFAGAHGQALALDVRVAAGDTVPVRLGFPGTLPVRVRLEDAAPPSMPAGSVIRVELSEMGPDEPPARELPGRHDRGRAGAAVVFHEPGLRRTPSLPPGTRYRVRAYAVAPSAVPPRFARPATMPARPSTRYVAAPSVVEAGGEVVVSKLLRGVVELTVRYEGAFPPSWGQWGTWLHFNARQAAGSAQGAGLWIGPNQDPPTPNRAVLHADPGVVRVSWQGAGVLPGTLPAIELHPGEVVRRVVLVRIDEGYDPNQPPPYAPPKSRIALRLYGLPEEPRGELVVFGLGRDDDGRPSIERDGLSLDDGESAELYDDDWRHVQTIHAALGSGWASRPVPLPAWGEVEIRLEPAGLVQVAPAVLAPPELGAVSIRRADGEPFGVGLVEEDGMVWNGSFEGSAPGRPGTVLGPFPRGEQVFEVWVGGIRRSTRRVQVEPGRIAVLRILD